VSALEAEDPTDGEVRPVDGPTEDGARRRLAAALRPLITMVTEAGLDDDDLLEAVEEVEAIAERIRDRAHPDKFPRRPPDMTRPPQEFFPCSPVTGMLNPIAPPVRVWAIDGPAGGDPEIRGEVFFENPYEGPPTCVHGGVIAATFDEVLGTANMLAGNPAMTGTLTIRYRKPTPLRTSLRIEGRCLGRDGRKVRTWGGIFNGDVLCAEAEGIFVMVGPARMMAMAEANPGTIDPAMIAAMRSEAAAFEASQESSKEKTSKERSRVTDGRRDRP
jgi:acyl-coenzyme A thioesterase PaaI-like protein